MTLDPDVAEEIDRIRKKDGRRFKQVLNDALRLGLRDLAGAREVRPYVSPTRPRDLGAPLLDITKVSTALDAAEGEDHR